jgi:hypothetical protein
MNRNTIVELLLREMAEEMPIVLRSLPDDRLWSVMAEGLVADADADALAARIAGLQPAQPSAPDWREVYGEMRAMVNEWLIPRAATAA